MKPKHIFQKRLFWDVNFDNIDYDAKARFVIERVFERGVVEDIRNCRRYYGDENVKGALLSAKWLFIETVYYSATLYNLKLEDFRCHKCPKEFLGHWTY